MILHGLSLRNWKNIGRLDLSGLDHPLVVLYGPNGTGKSSIVAGLRSCLFDYDHNSTAAPIRAAVPWFTKLAPEVTVEFESEGVRYRLMKKFSTRADGGAVLEKQSAGGNWSVVERDKEAAREACRILGGEKSEDGLNQLLWLTQGETRLPTSAQLNGSLQRQLEDVLGTLLTSRDWDFFDGLKQSCRTFFTAAMAAKKNSPLADVQAQHANCAAEVEALRRKALEAESLVRQYEELHQESIRERKHVADSEDEVRRLRQDHQAMQARRLEHQNARHRLEAAEREHRRAADALDQYVKRKQELADLERDVLKTQQAAELAEEELQRLAAELEELQRDAHANRAELDRQEGLRAELDDRRRLIELARDANRLALTLARFEEVSERVKELKQELSGIQAPGDNELKTLRKNRREAQKLVATLEAGALRLEIEPAGDVRFDLAIDSDEAAAIEADAPQGWQFRQRAELTIGKFGTVRISRGTVDLSLDETARELERLNREYGDALRGFGLSDNDADALDQLAQRQGRRDALTNQLRSEEQTLRELSPEGRDAVAGRLERFRQQTQAVLERRPELADWTPDELDLHARQQEFDAAVRDLKKRQQTLEAQAVARHAEKERAAVQAQQLRTESATCHTRRDLVEEQLRRMGDEFTLTEANRAAGQQLDAARQEVERTALTPEEQALAQQLQGAEIALERRRQRLGEHENRAAGLRGELRSLEGLHEDLAAAEARLTELTARRDASQVEADAHKLLYDLFEECRSSQVQRTTGLIGTQVLDWAQRLGLNGYHDVAFGQGYLPDGLHRHEIDQPVALHEESFGTNEQLALLARLAVGRLVANGRRYLAILDDPLTHADAGRHRRMLEILEEVTHTSAAANGRPAVAPLQVLVFTCHPERFDHLQAAVQINLADLITRE